MYACEVGLDFLKFHPSLYAVLYLLPVKNKNREIFILERKKFKMVPVFLELSHTIVGGCDRNILSVFICKNNKQPTKSIRIP